MLPAAFRQRRVPSAVPVSRRQHRPRSEIATNIPMKSPPLSNSQSSGGQRFQALVSTSLGPHQPSPVPLALVLEQLIHLFRLVAGEPDARRQFLFADAAPAVTPRVDNRV